MRSSAEVQADIDAAYEARIALVKGERVSEVQRGLDRRNLKLAIVTVPQISQLILVLEQEHAAALAAEQTAAGNPSRARRPIGLRWQ